MNVGRSLLVAAGALVLSGLAPGAARAQQADVRAQLSARGLPAGLVDQVAAVAADAAAHGLPVAPLADKALEGWAKRVPAPRIMGVLTQFAARMGEARDAVRAAGVPNPPGEVVSAAAEAMGRGMTPVQVGDVARAGGPAGTTAADVAPSLRVASALSAQGMAMDQAVLVVSRAERDGRSVSEILDLPSAMRAYQAEGMAPPEIGRRMMQGGPGPGPGGPEGGGMAPGRSGGRPPPPPGGTRPPPPGAGRGPA